MKIAVAGTGYVGLSMATLLAQHHSVVAVDVVSDKGLDFAATLDAYAAYRETEFVEIAVSYNYNLCKNFFDAHMVEDVIDMVLNVNQDAMIAIKSTMPFGYCIGFY